MSAAALLAGALALAGCGGGGNTVTPASGGNNGNGAGNGDGNGDGNGGGNAITLASATTEIGDCTDAPCVDAVVEKAEGALTAADLETLRGTAAAKKTALAAPAPLNKLSKTAAEQLADALAGAEALRPGSRHINTTNAELRPNEPWKKLVGSAIGGWEARSYNIPNPAGSSGRVQDIRVWQENEVYIRQLYRKFFAAGSPGYDDGNIDKNVGTSGLNVPVGGIIDVPGAVKLAPVLGTTFNKATVPSNFYTAGFTWNPDGGLSGQWELRGDFYDVPGIFVCASGLCVQQNDNNGNPVAATDLTKPSLPIGSAGTTDIRFIPSNFSEDETHVNAKWSKLQNPDFLNFGVYWNTEINDDGEVTTISVDPFAGGGGAPYTTTADIVRSDEGNLTAKYSGGAGGVYVRTETDDNEDVMATGYGEFTADANFTAVFGTAKDTLSGEITNFKTVSGNGADANGSWKVELSGDIKNGAVAEKETFHAQFYGEMAKERQSNGHGYAPYGLVGTFQSGGQLPDGHVTGAFGTECDGGNCVHN